MVVASTVNPPNRPNGKLGSHVNHSRLVSLLHVLRELCRGALPRGLRLRESLLVSAEETKAKLHTRKADPITCLKPECTMVSPNVSQLVCNHLLDLSMSPWESLLGDVAISGVTTFPWSAPTSVSGMSSRLY